MSDENNVLESGADVRCESTPPPIPPSGGGVADTCGSEAHCADEYYRPNGGAQYGQLYGAQQPYGPGYSRQSPYGGYGQQSHYQQGYPQDYQGYQPQRETNSMGTAGFVLSIITVIIGWLPYFGWAIWLMAVVFSCIGMSRRPRGLAIAGLIITMALPLLLIILIVIGVLCYSADMLGSGHFPLETI